MAKCREAQQYRAAVMGFMASFGAGASKGAYGDSPFGPLHTVSKFHMLSLCYYYFNTRNYVNMFLSLKQQAPDDYRPTLMLAMVRILMLVITTSTPPCPCTVYMGT